MSLELNPNSGLAFRNERGLERSAKAPHFKGEILFEGRRINVSIWERKTKSGKSMLSFNVEDAVAAEIERTEKRLDHLRNQSEQPESRDQLAETPDTVEKTMASNKRRKVA